MPQHRPHKKKPTEKPSRLRLDLGEICVELQVRFLRLVHHLLDILQSLDRFVALHGGANTEAKVRRVDGNLVAEDVSSENSAMSQNPSFAARAIGLDMFV